MSDGSYIRLEHLAVLRIGGAAARTFLARQLTCDVAALGPTTPLMGAWLTPKGRAVTLMHLLDAGDGTLRAVMPAELAGDVTRRLSLYILRDDVSVALSGDEQVLGLMGDAAHSNAVKGTFSLGSIPLRTDPPMALQVGTVDEVERAAQALAVEGHEMVDGATWELAQIRAGLPTVLAATREAFIPQMMNLDRLGAVSFSKGCYPGQEIVARTQHLGRIKRRTFIAHCDEQQPAALPGDLVTITRAGSSDAEAGGSGKVMRAASHTGGQDMLVVLPLDAVSEGAAFSLVHGPSLQVSPPPYSLNDAAS